MIARLLKVLPFLAVVGLAAPAAAAPVKTGHIEAELIARDAHVAPGSTTYVALRQKIVKGWHTYWRNPGDSGEATKIVWEMPGGWSAGDIVWATPHRQPTGPLMNYGYTGEVVLPVPIQAPAAAQPGQTVTLTAKAAFLVCAELCVPEDAVLTLELPVAAGPAGLDPKTGAVVAAALEAAPKPAGLNAVFSPTPQGVKLAVTGPQVEGGQFPDAYFFAFDGTLIDHAGAQALEAGPEGLTLTLPPGYAFTQGDKPAEFGGVLSLGDRAYEVTAKPGPVPAGAVGLGPPKAKAGPMSAGGLSALAFAFGAAFLGGLILNLMPCVFPVLSMKAASLAAHSGDLGEARRQGIAFLAGVLLTFLGLAGALIAARAAGAAVGWGFQLQSPMVVAGLCLVMLLTALNLSGVFEIGTSVQGAGQGLAARGGLAGSFFTGVLAVVVAAPCTAPFMAPALGFALTQSPPAALAVFAALGLGLAAPYVAVSFSPAVVRRMPRPGVWMDGLKRILAFPMYAAAAWLVWVFSLQAGSTGVAALMAAAVIIAFAAWLFGVGQRQPSAGWRRGMQASALPFAAAAALLLYPIHARPGGPAQAAATSPASAELPSEAWSPARVAALRAEGRPVFVNFTAAWCVTCQVNDKLALSTAKTAQAFKDANAVYLVADWTNRDEQIATALAARGRAGVPLYLVYPARTGGAEILPQILTEGTVVDALKKAAVS